MLRTLCKFMQMKKRITLKDIAKEFNVSISSVSKALSDSHEISVETKAKIQKYAKERSYKPNNIALSLLNKSTKTIGIIIPTILSHFFAKIFSGIEMVANEKGYNIITVITNGDLKKELDSIYMFKNGNVDGILISITEETQSKQYDNHLTDFMETIGPIVMFDRILENVSCDKIIVDDFNCAYKSTEFLIKTGCKNIAIVTVMDNFGIVKLRINGFRKAMQDNNISVNEQLISLNKQDDDFETEFKTMLDDHKVDAIIGLDEISTVESMIIAESKGYRIPNDISIIGYSNGNLFKYVKPSITCVNQHGIVIGKLATEKLIQRIEQNEEERIDFETEIIKTNIVYRNSTKVLG